VTYSLIQALRDLKLLSDPMQTNRDIKTTFKESASIEPTFLGRYEEMKEYHGEIPSMTVYKRVFP
jgi:hypothetical protein